MRASTATSPACCTREHAPPTPAHHLYSSPVLGLRSWHCPAEPPWRPSAPALLARAWSSVSRVFVCANLATVLPRHGTPAPPPCSLALHTRFERCASPPPLRAAQAAGLQAAGGGRDGDRDGGRGHREGVCVRGAARGAHRHERGPHERLHPLRGGPPARRAGLRQALPHRQPLRVDGAALAAVRARPHAPCMPGLQGIPACRAAAAPRPAPPSARHFPGTDAP